MCSCHFLPIQRLSKAFSELQFVLYVSSALKRVVFHAPGIEMQDEFPKAIRLEMPFLVRNEPSRLSVSGPHLDQVELSRVLQAAPAQLADARWVVPGEALGLAGLQFPYRGLPTVEGGNREVSGAS